MESFQIFPLSALADLNIGRVLVILPVLAAVIVLLRLLVGVRTYGIFAPMVIAISLMDMGPLPGMAVYAGLLLAGVGAKILFISRLRLPMVAESAVIMFVLVALFLVASAIPAVSLPLSGVFFPLIITTHVIEQASRTIEEHETGRVLSLLTSTLAVALGLAYLGMAATQLSVPALGAVFAVSVISMVLAGKYLGLRLSEIIRFKFLRRTHEHK